MSAQHTVGNVNARAQENGGKDVTLDGVVRNAGEHGKPMGSGVCALRALCLAAADCAWAAGLQCCLPVQLGKAKFHLHPGVKVREGDVAPTHGLGLAGRAGGEGQRANVVRAYGDADVRFGLVGQLAKVCVVQD